MMKDKPGIAGSRQGVIGHTQGSSMREVVSHIDEAGRREMNTHLLGLLRRVHTGEISGIAYAAFYGPQYDYATLGRVVEQPEYMLGILDMLAHEIRCKVSSTY